MKVLVPKTLTDAMLSSSTIAEPAASETAWVSGGTFALGDLRIRATTHRVYKCVLAVAGSAVLPEVDPTHWQDWAPTLRWAAFDGIVSSPSQATTTFTYVLLPGFFNAISFYALDGATIDVSVKNAPGGAVIYHYAGSLLEPPLGWYDWLFGRVRPLRKLVLENILPYPGAELTITVSGAIGATVSVGTIAFGDMASLLGEADENDGWGPEFGATAEPVTNSYIKIQSDGTAKIVRRNAATDLRVRVVLPASEADHALALVQEVLDIPACWIATVEDGFAGLNTFGLASGSLVYEGPNHSVFSINVKGLT